MELKVVFQKLIRYAFVDRGIQVRLIFDLRLFSSTSTKYCPLQQVEDYVRSCTWPLKNVKTMYRFNKLVFDRGDRTILLIRGCSLYFVVHILIAKYNWLLRYTLERGIVRISLISLFCCNLVRYEKKLSYHLKS